MRTILFSIILLAGCMQSYACNTDKGNSGNPDQENNNSKQETMKIKITVGDKSLTATMIDNVTTKAFMEMLPLTIEMTELHNNEKYANLSKRLPGKAVRPGTIHAGDLMLWDSNYKCLVLFYKTFNSPYSYVKLGTVDQLDQLEEVLGSDDVVVKFEELK